VSAVAGVRLTDVTRQYPGADRPAVDDVSLEIADGELFALLGPSGCGKSTLLKLIGGLEEPDAGEIEIGGRLANFVSPGRRDVAMVFQSYALYPHMTARENIRFPLRMRKVARAQAQADVERAARVLDLAELLDRRVDTLSGGQRQRVAVARAIVRDPAVLLMDEPLSNLDALLRMQTREELLRLHRELPGTIVYVTHDQVEAMTMGDRLGVMHGARLVQVGTPLDVYERPASRFVAGFMGTPPMSFVDGELTGEAGALVFRGDGVAVELREELARAALRAGGRRDGWTLGIRPEAVGVRSVNGRPGGGWLVDVVEQLGAESIVGLRHGSSFVRSRLPFGERASVGGAVEIELPRERVHLFAGDGRSVLA
jgi:multiple sugar transport system ATP-binding protein